MPFVPLNTIGKASLPRRATHDRSISTTGLNDHATIVRRSHKATSDKKYLGGVQVTIRQEAEATLPPKL